MGKVMLVKNILRSCVLLVLSGLSSVAVSQTLTYMDAIQLIDADVLAEVPDNYTQNLQQQFDDPLNQPNGYIHGSTENYEEIASYKAVYNRLLMYRGSSLHSGIINSDYNFDPSPETGRLTVTSFIEFS